MENFEMGKEIAELVRMNDLETLFELMEDSDDWMLQLDAAEGLSQLGERAGLDFLLSAKQSDVREVREYVREILDAPDIQRKIEVWKPKIQEQKSLSNDSNIASCRVCQHAVSRTAPFCPNCGELYPGLIEKCPTCGSKNIRITPKGFSIGKAVAGAVLAGPLGIAGGLHGRNDLEVKCSNCQRTTTIKNNEIR
jgi:hypothetical protein